MWTALQLACAITKIGASVHIGIGDIGTVDDTHAYLHIGAHRYLRGYTEAVVSTWHGGS